MVLFYLLLSFCVQAENLIQLNSKLQRQQKSIWTVFQLSYDSFDFTQGSLRFKLEFSESAVASMVLAINKKIPAVFNFDGSRVMADHVDYNGWKGGRTTHYITLPADYLNTTDSIYLSVGSLSVLSPGENFTISTEYSLGSLCPNDCSHRGKCLGYTCECDVGYIDYDCSTPAVLMEDDNWFTFTVAANVTGYAYFYLHNRSFIRITLRWEGVESLILLNWKGYKDMDLPSPVSSYGRTFLTADQNEKHLIYSTEHIRSDSVNIAILNKYSLYESVIVKIMIESDYSLGMNEYSTHLVAGIFTCGVLICMVSIAIKTKLGPEEPLSAREQRPVGIPPDVINKNWPKFKIKENNQEVKTKCVICLEELKPKDIVRRLRCRHIFHANCIDEWFNSNVSCCLCKRDYSVEDFNSTAEHLQSSYI